MRKWSYLSISIYYPSIHLRKEERDWFLIGGEKGNVLSYSWVSPGLLVQSVKDLLLLPLLFCIRLQYTHLCASLLSPDYYFILLKPIDRILLGELNILNAKLGNRHTYTFILNPPLSILICVLLLIQEVYTDLLTTSVVY